jgi:serine/threonine-protein kinase
MELSSLQAGTVIDRYVVERVIGEGGMATVLLVRHSALGSVHALKVLTLSPGSIRERLWQEGRVQAALSHPNIVAVTDVIEIGGSPGLIMEYVEGGTLDGLLRSRRLAPNEVDDLARGILSGVAEAHRHGLVHRDLKPANVLLKLVDGVLIPKVADFGLAKVLGGVDSGGGRTRTGSTMGTPHYMSPEQLRDAKSVGPRSDVFALGAILYELATGRRAFDGTDLLEIFNAVATGRYTPPREIVPDLPERMERAIVSALSVNPDDRPQSVEALAEVWNGGASSIARSPALPSSLGSAAVVDVAPTYDSLPESKAPPRSVSTMPPAGTALFVGAAGGLLMLFVVSALLVVGLGGVYAWTLGAGSSETPLAAAPPVAPAVATSTPPEDPEPGEEPAAVRPSEPAIDVPVAKVAPRSSNPTPTQDPAVPAPVVEAPVPVAADAPVEAARPAPTAASDDVELVGRQADPDPEERKKAVDALGRRTDDESIKVLAKFVREDPDSTVKAAAWTAVQTRYLARSGNVELLEQIVVAVASRGPERAAVEAVRALRQYCAHPDALKGALGHSSAAVRGAAVDALPDIARRTDDAVDYAQLLSGVAHDPDDGVRKKVDKARAALP